MAYSHPQGSATIITSVGRFRATSGEQLYCGDLVDSDFCQADASSGENHAEYIALEDIASGDEGWFAKQARIKKPSTVGTGGAVTRGDTGGTTGDILFLSTTQGKAVEVPDGDGILQVVGRVLSQDEVLLEPSAEHWDIMEYEAASKTLGASDSGKCFAVTGASTAVVVTLPSAVSDSGLYYTIINVAQDGDGEVAIDPNSVDTFVGVGLTEADGKKLTNTTATARCMDLLKLVASAGASAKSGFCVVEQRGTWAHES